MADPVWPVIFPQMPLSVSFQAQFINEKLTTEMDHPIPVMREYTSLSYEEWQVAWRFDNHTIIAGGPFTQWMVFNAWVYHKLDRGLLWFQWPTWVGVGAHLRRVRFRPPSTYVVEAAGANVLVNATLIVESAPRMTEAAVDAAIA